MFFTLTRLLIKVSLLSSIFVVCAHAQGVKRIVILKIDGLPGYYLDSVVKQRDAATGKSVLPWVEEVFYKNGTRVPNFYTRGMSLSGPSWGQLDTGQHVQIKGNVEFDRFTLHAYDYLNIVPYYIDYGRNKKVDMPAVEVMDQLKIPLLCDAFAVDKRYTAQQLYQRGYDWAVFAGGFVNMIPRDRGDLIDEWTIGFDLRKMTVNQVERDIEGKLISDDIDYFDYYDTSFDHMSHHNNDAESRLMALRELDRTIGRIWSSIQLSSRADETALVLVSDHGFNSDERVYSQGFNLVKLLAAKSGGGHHVITKRRLLLDYSIKGFYPLVPLIRTSSNESYYLKGQNSTYPTALVDFDGNERSSIHLRQSDLNVIHILLQELRRGSQKKNLRSRNAVADAVVAIIEKHRARWQGTIREINEELDALGKQRLLDEKEIAALPMKSGDGVSRREAEENRRQKEQIDLALEAETKFRKYLQTLTNLLALRHGDLLAKNFRIEDVIAPDSMGEANSVYDLQNYVVGLSDQGAVLDANGKLDFAKSFKHVNYFDLFLTQRVRNNVQQGIGNRPVDFVATRIPFEEIKESLPAAQQPSGDAIWLYGGADRQVLILAREVNGERSYRYLPIADLTQNFDGKITFATHEWSRDFPLKYLEDADLNVVGDKTEWLNSWHSEVEWLRAVHKTEYSIAIIGLNEQLQRHALTASDGESQDETLIRRFRQRQRRMTEADLLILANDHWNFDVRGFNPGGNHGSFFRVSTNSTFMIAGGAKTGIPRSFVVNEPYDSLSFTPTILKLMGKVDADGNPSAQLRGRGFHKFPGRIVSEITYATR